ncbi:MAG: hypothetical protein K0S18_1626 [Anaerocolumna sp.]|jgi:membrane-bound acyltransferase YfiQ involved in biofilm formation|nr:hypothetical protein [Anaerocolumna sp.]
MKDHLSKFNFLTEVLTIFSVTILFISIVGFICGEDAKQYSSLFQLGGEGIANKTVFQLLASSFIIAALKVFFFSDMVLKNKLVLWRTIWMLCAVVVVIICFVLIFKWFPINNLPAWIGFFLSFVGFFTVSTILMILKTKLEGKKYDRLLQEYKNKQEGV